MFRYLFIASFLLALGKLSAQSVSSVELSQEGKTLVIEYLLQATTPQEILLYFSTDGGKTFSEPLQKVSGDVGKRVAPGQKRIVWNVLEEVPELVGDNIVFMVEIAEGLIWEAKNGRPRMEWVAIPSGTFMMGSPDSETDRKKHEGPRHQVTLSGFKMSKYEVTFVQYDAFCEATGRRKPYDYGWGRGNRPVINVSWNDATDFAQWMGCRLPTEAEWEYACRAGTSTPFNTGGCLSTAQANYDGRHPYQYCNEGSRMQSTQPVGSYAPNAWGLFDMHGNVYEWCSDWFGSYPSSAQTNPSGPASGSYRVLRGGSWDFLGRHCRSAHRDYNGPTTGGYYGFRVVVPN
jgi:formylglycine-generating enzyme required for sulfatase activity